MKPNMFRTGFVVATLGIVLLSAFALWAAEGKTFSHKLHLEQGAGCTDCHDTEQASGLPSLKRDTCAGCHDQGTPEPVLPVKSRRLKAVFPHRPHAKAVECGQCHKAVAEETASAGQPLVMQGACTACHAAKGIAVAAGDCKACHGGDARSVKPADHAAAWKHDHGQAAQWRVFDQHGQDCTLCHRSDACKACHKRERPQSHTALWRNRTHGLSAEWDRDACKTCHETGTCVRCHQSTKPLNHTGAWRATHSLAAELTSNEHCAVCHQPTYCATCHSGR
jgi:c(7)-type cytochrome triheme protein